MNTSDMYRAMMLAFGVDFDAQINRKREDMIAMGDKYWEKVAAREKREKESNVRANENINRINEIRKRNGLPPLKLGGE